MSKKIELEGAYCGIVNFSMEEIITQGIDMAVKRNLVKVDERESCYRVVGTKMPVS